MAGKPVHTRAKPGKPFGRQAIWQAIRARKADFSLADLADSTRQPVDTVRSYVKCLMAAGLVAQAASGRYDLVRDTGIEAPRLRKDGTPVPTTSRDAMWRAIRMLKGTWSWRDLAFAATTDDLIVSEVDAQDYCKHLAAAGYLRVVERGKGIGGTRGRKGTNGGIPARYCFVPGMNTGPRPPMVQRLKTVFDPNLGRVMHQEAPHDD